MGIVTLTSENGVQSRTPELLRCCRTGAGFQVPGVERFAPDLSEGVGCEQMAAWVEMAIDESMSGDEVLSLRWRFEALHLPFSSSRRTMRVLSPIVQVSALPVLNVGKQVALGDAVAAHFVGHDHPRHVL